MRDYTLIGIIIAAVLAGMACLSSKIGGRLHAVPMDSIFYYPADIIGNGFISFSNATIVVMLTICGVMMVVYYIAENIRH